MILYALIFSVGAILTTVAGPGKKGLDEIYIGRLLSGIGVGGIGVCSFLDFSVTLSDRSHQSVAPAYVSGMIPSFSSIRTCKAHIPHLLECSPKDIRGRISGIFQVFDALGICLSYFTNCTFFLILLS